MSRGLAVLWFLSPKRGVCVSSSHQAVSEERERKQETVRASIRKIAHLLKSETRGNNEKRKKKKEKPT